MLHPNSSTPTGWLSCVRRVFAKTRRYTLVALALLFAVTLLSGLVLPHAVADELAPEAPGSIAGMVKGSNGEPQAGIEVTLYQFTVNNYNSWSGLRSTTTQADGKYRFLLLPAGIYRIGAGDPKRVYAPVYYPTAPTLAKGTDLSVVGNQLTNIDVTLQPGGQITGIVTLTGSLPITDGSVELLQEVERADGNAWEMVQRITQLPTTGVYSFTGLSALPYRICANSVNTIFFFYECYENAYTVNEATSLTLTTGATISNINLVLGERVAVSLPQLGGRITSLDNEPLADIEVYASPVSLEEAAIEPAPIQSVTIAASVAPTVAQASLIIPNPSYYTRTDKEGNYRFSLRPNRYRLYFTDLSGQYAYEYYNDSVLAESATVIEVAENAVITDINVQLAPGNHINGLITILGQPAYNGFVSAEMKIAGGWRHTNGAQIDPNTGRYAIDGLPTGIYRVMAGTYYSYDFDTYSGYFGGSTPETAAEITLAAGVTKTADITLAGGPLFEGSVSGRVTANGAPLAGARVFLYVDSFSCCSSRLPDPLVYVFTDAEGRYAINGLTENLFEMGAIDPAGIYATTYYSDHAIPASANPLFIDEDNSFTDININLPLAGALSGRVTTAKGKAVAGLRVSVYAADPAFDPGYLPIRLVSSDTTTDADGRYLVQGLHATVYYVCFNEAQNNNYGKCYGRPTLSYNDVGGVPINVVAGETKTGIDLLWGPDLATYLPIIAQ